MVNTNYKLPANVKYPLHLAMKYNRRDLFEEHIFDYDLNAKDPEGKTPLHIAAMYRTSFYYDFYSERSHFRMIDIEGWAPIYYAIKSGWRDFIKHALELDPNQTKLQDNWGLTPLHVAVIYNQIEILRDLLEYGDPSALLLKDVKGRTPLYEAVFWFREEAVRIIKEFDNFEESLIDIPDDNGYTPFDIFDRKLYILGEDIPRGLTATFANPAHEVIGKTKNLFEYLFGCCSQGIDLESISLDPLDEADKDLDI